MWLSLVLASAVSWSYHNLKNNVYLWNRYTNVFRLMLPAGHISGVSIIKMPEFRKDIELHKVTTVQQCLLKAHLKDTVDSIEDTILQWCRSIERVIYIISLFQRRILVKCRMSTLPYYLQSNCCGYSFVDFAIILRTDQSGGIMVYRWYRWSSTAIVVTWLIAKQVHLRCACRRCHTLVSDSWDPLKNVTMMKKSVMLTIKSGKFVLVMTMSRMNTVDVASRQLKLWVIKWWH